MTYASLCGYMDSGGKLRSNIPPAPTEQLRKRLDSWKEIAAYLGRSEKTVRRWEENEELPVHRLLHEKRGSVYAYSGELDAWREARHPSTESLRVNESWPAIVEIPKSQVKAQNLARRARLPVLILSVLLIAIATAWFAWRRTGSQSGAPAGARIQSLAVLPLENLSGDTEQEYFADGMTAELITELAKIGSLRVISRTSSMRYKRARKPLSEIARELNVDALVEGEVLKTEHRMRITAQLIDAATDRHLWAESYDRDLRDAVELQGEVVESITAAIRTKVTPEERARLIGKHRVNPEAYEAYLKGRFFWNKRTESGLNKSIDYFKSAINKDPGYALAYAGLADSYSIVDSHDTPPQKGSYLKAEAAARKGLELDNSLGEAHIVLATVIYQLNRDWRGAEREFKRAIELSPGYATAYQRYSMFLTNMSRHEESLTAIHKAQALDPLSAAIAGGVGGRLLWARRYDEAIKQLLGALEMDPNLGLTHNYLGLAYQAKGNTEKAIEELRKAARLDQSSTHLLASLAYGYAVGGYIRNSRSILKDLGKQSQRGYVPRYDIAIIYAGLGAKGHAFEWLGKSCEDRDVDFSSLNVDPELDNLRSDPRFRDLQRCAGLAQ